MEGSHDKLEIHAEIGHTGSMDHAINQSPPGWAELLDASLTEATRGELVPASEVHDAIRTALAELESEMAEHSGPRLG